MDGGGGGRGLLRPQLGGTPQRGPRVSLPHHPRAPAPTGTLQPGEPQLPFPTLDMGEARYKLFGVVTNRDKHGDEVIRW